MTPALYDTSGLYDVDVYDVATDFVPVPIADDTLVAAALELVVAEVGLIPVSIDEVDDLGAPPLVPNPTLLPESIVESGDVTQSGLALLSEPTLTPVPLDDDDVWDTPTLGGGTELVPVPIEAGGDVPAVGMALRTGYGAVFTMWAASRRPESWDASIRPVRFFSTVFVREDRSVALTFVAYGPFTENEIPEALLIRVLRPLRAGGTEPLPIFNQTPEYDATVSIQPPSGPIQHRSAEIVDPAQLPIDYPQDFSGYEDGWLRVIWVDGDFPNDGTYAVQVTLDNGEVRLKSTDVWRPEVNVGPASDVGA